MPQSCPDSFERAALPYLQQAYHLARWLARNEQDAEDIVQEAYLRALRFFGNFRGGDIGPWLLKIVRNTSYTWLQQNRKQEQAELDGELLCEDRHFGNPEQLVIQKSSGEVLRKAIESLPPRFRELLVLRELHDLSYQEISEIVGVPVGTVMSGLSRARARLRQCLLASVTAD